MLNFALVCILLSITRLITQILDAFATPASLPRTRHFGRILIQSENPQIMGSDQNCKSQFRKSFDFTFLQTRQNSENSLTTKHEKFNQDSDWKVSRGLSYECPSCFAFFCECQSYQADMEGKTREFFLVNAWILRREETSNNTYLDRPRFNPIDGLGCCPRVNSGQGVIFRSSKVGLEALIEGPIFG